MRISFEPAGFWRCSRGREGAERGESEEEEDRKGGGEEFGEHPLPLKWEKLSLLVGVVLQKGWRWTTTTTTTTRWKIKKPKGEKGHRPSRRETKKKKRRIQEKNNDASIGD